MTMQYKALTIDPIWCWAIFAGLKVIENRTWPTRHRGDLVVHASKNRSREKAAREWFAAKTFHTPPTSDHLRAAFAGRAIGLVEVVDCVPLREITIAESEFAEGPHCWRLRDPREFTHAFLATGKMGLWNLDIDAPRIRVVI
jgi:hypothetical protein